jgi:hypothetical protein
VWESKPPPPKKARPATPPKPAKPTSPPRPVKTPEESAFEVLGLMRTSDFDIIRAVYLKLAFKLHPDKPEGNADKFKAMQNAYDLLESLYCK